jgi:di/tricarboxylate transporter
VYGSGGYTFKDFMRIGWPLTVIYMVVSALILGALYF